MKLNIKESLAEHDINGIDIREEPIPYPEITTPVKKKDELKVFSESDIMYKTHTGKKKTKEYTNIQSSYEQAIKMLKSVRKYRVPFEKMMIIATISSEITDCVNNFWKDMENVITSSLLNIDADELMTIFIYIVIKSHMTDLLIHSKLIKEFTTSTTRSTMVGYYYTTLEASLIFILSVNSKEDLMDKDRLRQSLVPNKSSFNGSEEDDYGNMQTNAR
jgi:hypothetical protein